MCKEIIVNGVDVSGCEFCDWKGSDIPQCRIRQVSFEPTCKGYNCYYKQLLRKEQECGELKRVKDNFFKHAEISHEAVLNKNKIIDEQEKQLDQLKVENEELKEKVKELHQGWIDCDKERNLQEANSEFRQRVINRYKQTLTEVKDIAEPYKMTIKKICGNCKKYDDCHACCYKDINCYKYTSAETNACEEFTYLDKFVPNILANNILQKISECEVK